MNRPATFVEVVDVFDRVHQTREVNLELRNPTSVISVELLEVLEFAFDRSKNYRGWNLRRDPIVHLVERPPSIAPDACNGRPNVARICAHYFPHRDAMYFSTSDSSSIDRVPLFIRT